MEYRQRLFLWFTLNAGLKKEECIMKLLFFFILLFFTTCAMDMRNHQRNQHYEQTMAAIQTMQDSQQFDCLDYAAQYCVYGVFLLSKCCGRSYRPPYWYPPIDTLHKWDALQVLLGNYRPKDD